MSMRFLPVLATVLAFAGATLPAIAQSGSEGVFTVHNDTDENVIIGFYVGTDGESFSDNWLSEPMMPGETAVARFTAAEGEGDCINYFVVGWLGADDTTEVLDEPTEIDICEASNVYLGDNEITFD